MKQKMESLERNQIWELVDLSKNSKVISCIWIFRKKDNEQSKLRLFTKRYAQEEGID